LLKRLSWRVMAVWKMLKPWKFYTEDLVFLKICSDSRTSIVDAMLELVWILLSLKSSLVW
jgi:hypothetical protein